MPRPKGIKLDDKNLDEVELAFADAQRHMASAPKKPDAQDDNGKDENATTVDQETLELQERQAALVRLAARTDEGREKGSRRSETLGTRQLTHRVRKERALDDLEIAAELDRLRPRTRADCEGGERPCIFVRCKHNLYLDVNPQTGSIKLNFPDKELWELDYTCALDVADIGGITLEEVGTILNITRERVRQLEVVGLKQIQRENDREERSGDTSMKEDFQQREATEQTRYTGGNKGNGTETVKTAQPAPSVQTPLSQENATFGDDIDFGLEE